ncbi:phage tail assembly chaperone [Pelagibacterium flavum]|uniref:Phage tail assembly chaperone n=1 Tax=Pelagibacterium flavum TaxID=2984530 RepID=A0ABY6IK60_9HYPH|nr:tail fiber assembly protein [Pelagibacterium sp. YIM 151497]UYQ70958.1 phage tail assembly chaperone [Pelagibacterium sp. YIM 151497]
MEIHSRLEDGSFDVSIEGRRSIVPDDPGNRHRQLIADWEAMGNTIPHYEAPNIDHLARLREERDQRLRGSDWVILRNLETLEPVPQTWLDYRQALRDLPETTDNPADPDWPELPTL